MSEEQEYNSEELYYQDWLSDHKSGLQDEFIKEMEGEFIEEDEEEDKFAEFCRIKFTEEEE